VGAERVVWCYAFALTWEFWSSPMYQTVHLRRSDQTVDRLIRAAFPEFNGHHVTAYVTDTVRFWGTQWDEGHKREYAVVRLTDLRRVDVHEAPFMQRDAFYDVDHKIPVGFVIVVHVYSRGGQSIEIHSPGANISPLLPAPVNLTPDEETVLVATRCYKSSYAGISNYRFHEARRSRGITAERWETAKAALIGKRLLNRAGALTVEGRNAARSLSSL
jgi:hypothetical protein